MTGAVLLALEGQHDDRALTAEGLDVTGLLAVANRPLLQQAADLLCAAGVRDVVVASTASVSPAVRRALGDQQRQDLRVRHVEVPDDIGAVSAVLAARRLLEPGPIVLHADDSLVLRGLPEAIATFEEHDLDILQVAAPVEAPAPVPESDAAIVLRQRPQPVGVQVVGERALHVLEALEAEHGAAAALDDLWEAVRSSGGRAELAAGGCAWRFSGEVESFLEINRLVLDALVTSTAGGHAAAGRVLVDPTADVSASKLRGPLLIGPGVTIRDSYVGPYTCIAGGACLEGAEIEYSVVLPNARITHVGVRIEDSVIGAGAHVNRTFRMPTALRMHVGPGARVSLS